AAIAARGEAFTVRSGRRKIAARRYGEGPAVLLVHGWGGRGSQLYAFVEPLVASGFSAITVDAPAHGAPRGKTSSLPSFARAIAAIIDEIGSVHGVIAHSMGAAAAMLAIHDGAPIPRAVLVAPPSRANDFFRRFAEYVGLDAGIAGEARA